MTPGDDTRRLQPLALESLGVIMYDMIGYGDSMKSLGVLIGGRHSSFCIFEKVVSEHRSQNWEKLSHSPSWQSSRQTSEGANFTVSKQPEMILSTLYCPSTKDTFIRRVFGFQPFYFFFFGYKRDRFAVRQSRTPRSS